MSYVVCEDCEHQTVFYKNEVEEFLEIIKFYEADTPSCIKFPNSSFSESYRNSSKL